ncbi:MAG: hypothetical protein ABFD16_10255 [Thermoguttaceae bacterium]|jgi:hypothetical protein
MQFSIIYSVDCPADQDIDRFAPPEVEKLWEQTEGDAQYEYGYLEGRWLKGHHRQWCALLSRKQFDAFIARLGLVAEHTETMGSLGAPGFGLGWAPALAFSGEDPDAIQCAYVTPIPEIRKEAWDDDDWRRVKAAVLTVYGKEALS